MQKLIANVATKYNLSANIVYGVCMTESNMNPHAARYEAGYQWLYKTSTVKPGGCSLATEIVLQKTSWGLMQVMGAVYRELGYTGWLTSIVGDVEAQLDYGCRHLSNKIRRYGLFEGILAYNSGSPRKGSDGGYVNFRYARKVSESAQRAKGDGLFPDSNDNGVVWLS